MMTSSTKRRSFLIAFILAYGLCFAVQLLGASLTTAPVLQWYPGLVKSPLNPPPLAFPIAWTTLYFLMAFAAARVVVRVGWRARPIGFWLAQLGLGLLWSFVFFGQQSPLGGLVVILAMLAAVLATLVTFWKTDRVAGALILPLALWLTLATHLNLYICLHN